MACPLPSGWTPSEEKALKLEAMHHVGKPVRPGLQIWLDYHRPPLTERPADYHKRKRAALAARLEAKRARRDLLMNMRKEALTRAAKAFPRPRCHPLHPDNLQWKQNKHREEQALQEARQAAADAEERAAREARVKLLMAMRAAAATSIPPLSVLLHIMGPSHPAYVWREVGRLSHLPEVLVLLRLSKSINLFLNVLLYRNIAVRQSARRMVKTLATNRHLLSLVESIYFQHPTACIHPGQWASILPGMHNLGFLMITPFIPLSLDVIPSITFRLQSFCSTSTVDAVWAQLITSQRELTELVFNSDFYGNPPASGQLPMLRVMKGRPSDLAQFAQHHHLVDLWFFTGYSLGSRSLNSADLARFAASPARLETLRISIPDFLKLLEAAPDVVRSLLHLVVDEDWSWSHFTRHSSSSVAGSTLGKLGSALDRSFVHLTTLYLVCSKDNSQRAQRRLLTRADASSSLLKSPEDMEAEKKTKKRKMRSLVPRLQPLPRAAPPVSSVRRHAALAPSKPSSTTDWSPEAEAAWLDFGKNVAEIASRWAGGDLGDETETVDSEDTQQRAEHEQEMDRLWDHLMTRVLDDMPPLERRQFLLEQRAELEWSSRSAYIEPLITDWSPSTAEYIDQ
ncbi:hypothetical protein K438DRAFT_1966081 [Mycena galopus ATCC 62051]|nr:hypothetical protein K438DRAFT_1966081 [Mycena galopus ATCC 62051]